MDTANTAVLTLPELSRRLHLAPSTIRRMVRRGTFPPPRVLSPGRRAWLERDVAAWLNACPIATRERDGAGR